LLKITKNTIIKIKNSASMFNRLDTDEERINKLEDKSKENIQTKT